MFLSHLLETGRYIDLPELFLRADPYDNRQKDSPKSPTLRRRAPFKEEEENNAEKVNPKIKDEVIATNQLGCLI